MIVNSDIILNMYYVLCALVVRGVLSVVLASKNEMMTKKLKVLAFHVAVRILNLQ